MSGAFQYTMDDARNEVLNAALQHLSAIEDAVRDRVELRPRKSAELRQHDIRSLIVLAQFILGNVCTVVEFEDQPLVEEDYLYMLGITLEDSLGPTETADRPNS
jgi:hypothetical protein